MRKVVLNLCGFVLFFSISVAISAEEYFYFGGGIGQSNIEQDDVIFDEDFDGDDFAFKAFAGYRFHKHFASEVAYLDFGEPDDTITALGIDIDTEIEAYAIALYLAGLIPIGEKFLLFGKVGGAYWDAEAKSKALGASARDSQNDIDLAYGVGASFAFTEKIAVRAEYEAIDDTGDLDELSIATVGAEFRF